MKTIIAPTDFSDPSVNAVNYAADLAAAINADLILLNVVQNPVTISEIPLPEPVFEDMLRIAGRDLQDLEVKLALRTKQKIGIATEIMAGDVENQIIEISKDKKPFAIVMGVKSGKPIERFFFGSHSLSASRYFPYPVLAVPETSTFSGINHIGLACDLENVTDTLPFALIEKWLTAFHATLDIIHVSKKEKEVEAGKVSESISLQNHLGKFNPRFHFLTGESVEEGLAGFAKDQKLDLLIVIPKKHGFFGLFDERHSRKLIALGELPVLALH